MGSEKRKRVFKMAPCPDYDIAGMEQWLADMAAQGYMLKRFFTNLIAVFEVQEPQNLRYGIATVSSNAFLVPDLDTSLDNLKDYCAAYGWNYITHRSIFCIFVTEDETALALHTDSDIEAMTLEKVRRERRNNLILPIFWIVILSVQLIANGFWLAIAQLGSMYFLPLVLILVISLSNSTLELRHLHDVEKAVRDGRSITKNRNSKAYQMRSVLVLASLIILLAMTGVQYYNEKTGNGKIPFEHYTGDIPTLTIQDLVEGDIYISTDQSKYSNFVLQRTDLLIPVYIQFAQNGAVYEDGICQFSGGITVEYMETRIPWFARKIAEDYQKNDKNFWFDRINRYKELPLPDLGVDYAAAYEHLLPVFVLAEGNKVVYVYYHQSSGGVEMTMDEITQMYAESLK